MQSGRGSGNISLSLQSHFLLHQISRPVHIPSSPGTRILHIIIKDLKLPDTPKSLTPPPPHAHTRHENTHTPSLFSYYTTPRPFTVLLHFTSHHSPPAAHFRSQCPHHTPSSTTHHIHTHTHRSFTTPISRHQAHLKLFFVAIHFLVSITS
jgi:hypothetical protein